MKELTCWSTTFERLEATNFAKPITARILNLLPTIINFAVRTNINFVSHNLMVSGTEAR